jgi:Uri superfamily endonuclease
MEGGILARQAAADMAENSRKPPIEMLHDLAPCGLEKPVIGRPGNSAISSLSGAYMLLVGIEQQVPISIAGGDPIALRAGWYAYCGSAKGPGGIRARVNRHFRPRKPCHWHIDQLTNGEVALWALTTVGGDECVLIQNLVESGTFATATPGFGSSDCRSCESHLMIWLGR